MRTIVCMLIALIGFTVNASGRTIELVPEQLPPGAYSSSDKPKGGNTAHFYAECFLFSCTDGIAVTYLVKRTPHKRQWRMFRQTFFSIEGQIKRDKELLVFVDREGIATAVAKKTGKWFGPYWELLPGVGLTVLKDDYHPYMPFVRLELP